MLKKVALRNFKLFDEHGVSLEPGRITVLIGANGTGKSTLLQALLVLKQSVGGLALQTDGPLINLGPYNEVVHAQDARHHIEIDVSASYEDFTIEETIDPFLPSGGVFEYHSAVAPEVMDQQGSIGGDPPHRLDVHWGPNSRDSSSVTEPSGKLLTIGRGTASFAIYSSKYIGRPFYVTPAVVHESPAARDAERNVRRLFSTIHDLLQSYYFLPAIRGFEKRSYGVSTDELPADLTSVGGPEQQAELVANLLASDRKLTAQVAKWMDSILGGSSGLGARLQRGRVVGETEAGMVSVNLLNEAFGLNQLLAPLFWLGRAKSGALIGIEEPEIHLHPRAQAALCDVFVDVATTEDKQLVLTTHSEHILLALLTVVADGRLAPKDLAVYEFRRDGNAARAERLEVNEYGQVEGGLRGFLEVDLDEIGDLIRARLR